MNNKIAATCDKKVTYFVPNKFCLADGHNKLDVHTCVRTSIILQRTNCKITAKIVTSLLTSCVCTDCSKLLEHVWIKLLTTCNELDLLTACCLAHKKHSPPRGKPHSLSKNLTHSAKTLTYSAKHYVEPNNPLIHLLLPPPNNKPTHQLSPRLSPPQATSPATYP